MRSHESCEMYLESILILKEKNAAVHAIDVANFLQYSKPSVSRAMGILQSKGYITVDKRGNIDFTVEGRRYAESVYEKHHVLTSFLLSLGVGPAVAESDACRIEHVISQETFAKIRELVKEGKE